MNFLYPEVFFMMFLPLVLLIVLLLTSKKNIQKYFSEEILEKLSVGKGHIGTTTRNALFFAALIFFIIALGRPVIDQKEQEIEQKLIPVVVALDLSASMYATDIYPDRITLAKEKLKQFIEKSDHTIIGVVLFARDTYVLSPVTEDFVSLRYLVNNLDTNMNFPNGSNIYGALEAVNYMLEDFEIKNLLILSDGGNSKSYTQEIEYAKKNNIVIYTLALATQKGSAIPERDAQGYLTDSDGNIVIVSLNQSIKELALQTGGGYMEYSLDHSDIDAIVQRVNIQSQKEQLKSHKFKTYTELFYYPLGVGLFFLFLALHSLPRKKLSQKFFSFVCVGFCCVPSSSYGDLFPFQTIQKAQESYEQKQYSKAADHYRKLPQTAQSLYNLGGSLYKDGKYQEAIEVYKKVVTQDQDLERKKLHNIGNSFVKLNDLQNAKKFYEKSLKLKEDPHTRENLKIVNKALEEQEKKQKQENQESQEKQENQESQEKQENQEKQEKQENQEDSKEQQNRSDQQKEEIEPNGSANQEQDQSQISQMEERKWMEQLENRKTPILLQKANTQKESKTDEIQPW